MDIREKKKIIVCLCVCLMLLNVAYEYFRGRRSRDRMVVGFTTTYAISA
jgi:hypothetical protein